MAVVNLDTATRLDIICRKGDTFDLTIDFGQDVTSGSVGTWKMDIRDSDEGTAGPGSGGTAAVIWENNGTTYFTASGNELRIQASGTSTWGSGVYVYDLQTNNNGVVKTWLYGTFTINEDVTV